MANDYYIGVYFVRLVVGGNYVWHLVILVIFMGFGQAVAKRCRGRLIKSLIEVKMPARKGGPFL